MTNLTSQHYWIAAIHLPEVGPRSVLRWLTRIPSIEQLFKASPAELREVGLTEAQITALNKTNWRVVEEHIKWGEQSHHYIVTLDDPAYPPLLKEITYSPLVLFVKGDPAILSNPQIAMVGSRSPTPAGTQNATNFASALAAAGYAVTSGLALGVDGACHRGALAVNGKTIAVMGAGLHQIYPASHRALATAIVEQGGALVSEFPLGMLPYAGNFPRRNRLIAGLSLGVLVVEAAMKSGSLITAKYALEQGREVFAIPGSIHHPLAKGCHYLIRQGAKLVETAQDVIEETGSLQQFCKIMTQSSVNPPMSDYNRVVFDQVGHEITGIDAIIMRTGLTASEVSSILLLLELDGYIRSVSGGYIRNLAN